MTGPNFQPETCRRCDGSGTDRYPNANGEPMRCQGCRGQGSALVAQPARDCASCGGTGVNEEAKGRHPICVVCQGTGWAHRWTQPAS